MTNRTGLSKSRVAAFEQCAKRLWLQVHRAELADNDPASATRFAAGHQIGAVACSLVPDGHMVVAQPDLRAALDETSRLLAGVRKPLFEATLKHDGVLVRIDILEPDDSDGWRLAEVKSSTNLKPYQVSDLATQVWVARNAGLKISQASVRHIDSHFILQREEDYRGLLKDTDATDQIEPVSAGRAALVAAAREVLNCPEPTTTPGVHCNQPFPCEFTGVCHKDLPTGPEWPVSILPFGGGRSWEAKGVYDLLEIAPGDLDHPLHRRVHHATVAGTPFHDVEGARSAIEAWPWPRTWLDFETIGFAVPRWIGTRPYQQIPFQFSAHVETEDGAIMHYEFLSLDGEDPRRRCAEALLSCIPADGAIVAYNASFEKGCILDLAAGLPDLADGLRALADRLVDLLPVTRNCWYHRDQRGSWSIKAVLPTVAPTLSYADLDVSNGEMAQMAYLEAVAAHTTAARRAELDLGLRRYCGRDTEAMIVLARRLTGVRCSASHALGQASSASPPLNDLGDKRVG